MRKPSRKLTIRQLAAQIILQPVGRELNFSQNEDGSDYWGAVTLSLFESHVTLIGYYGGCVEMTFNHNDPSALLNQMEDTIASHFEEEFLWVFDQEVWVCERCGGLDVEHQIWAKINDGNVYSSTLSDSGWKYDYYCNQCEDHTYLDKKEIKA